MSIATGRLSYVIGQAAPTAKAFASRIGIRADSLSRVRCGRAAFSAGLALKIEARTGYRAEWLLTGSGPMQTDGRVREGKPPVYETSPGPEDTAAVLLVTVAKCERCRAVLEPGAQLCHTCGAVLTWPKEDGQA